VREVIVCARCVSASTPQGILLSAPCRIVTRISTNIRTGDEEQTDNFGLIEAASIRRKHGLDGRLLWVEIKLSDWVFNAIKSQEVLTLHPTIFA
jgi:hypothetical protein